MSLPRHIVRKVLKGNKGELARLARRLGVTPTTVSQTLRGRTTSAKILTAATERAAELIESAAEDAA